MSDEQHRGGWQEDAHTDVVHNVVDALTLLGYRYQSDVDVTSA